MDKKFFDGLMAVLWETGMFIYSDRVNMTQEISKAVARFLKGKITWKGVTDTVLDEVKYYANDRWGDYPSEQRHAISVVKGFIYNFVMEGKVA